MSINASVLNKSQFDDLRTQKDEESVNRSFTEG